MDMHGFKYFWSHYKCVQGLCEGHFAISEHEWSHQLRKVERLSEGTVSKHAMDELKLVKKITTPQKEAEIGRDLWVSWGALCVYDWKNVSETPTLRDVLVWLPSHSWFLVYRGSGRVPGCKVLWVGLNQTHHIPTVLQPRDVTLATVELQPNHSSLKVTHKNSRVFFSALCIYLAFWPTCVESVHFHNQLCVG